MGPYESFLFVMPSFLHGAARTLDLAGLYDTGFYNESQTPEQADALAIAHDWAVVGDDLRKAIVQHKPKTEHCTKRRPSV